MGRYALPKTKPGYEWRAWYNTARWKRLRDRQLQKEPLCRYCMAYNGRPVPATVADHITPHRGEYEAFWNAELQSLCATCHAGAKQELERSGRLRGHDEAGHPLKPPPHWR